MNINPQKLVRQFEVSTSVVGELRLNWESPRELADGEELVVVRRKDAFPVEIRNRNFEDRYTDVAQVEVFRGSPVYLSHLIPNGQDTLILSSTNFYSPPMFELERDNKYTGRLIRDSLSQVFRITGNTESEIYYESISRNPDNQVIPVEGAFVILADFVKDRRSVQTLSLLENANTLTVIANTFTVGDSILLNNEVSLDYGNQWTSGATPEETAQNILTAMQNSGIRYNYTNCGSTILIQLGSQTTLSITSTNTNAEILTYGAARGKIFINQDLKLNEIRNLVIQDGDLNFSHIKSNTGKYIELYTDTVSPPADINILDSHNNTFPSAFIDTYRSESEAIRKKGSGLEGDVFYYYTNFTTPILSHSVTYNEADLGGENPLPYTVDKVAPYYARIFYESLVYVNKSIGSYTYNASTGDLQYTDSRYLVNTNIQIGDQLADSLGQRHTIINIDNLASGSFRLATGLTVGTEPIIKLHGSVVKAQVPVGFGNIVVGDTFKDIAGNSFQVAGTNSEPLGAVSIPPGNAFDISQGLIDENVMTNPFLVPYNYNPTDGGIYYGERSIAQNTQLSPYNYDSSTGVVTYTTNIELGLVEAGQFFIDGSDSYFEILSINPLTLEVGLATGLTVDTTVINRRSGSVVAQEGFLDPEGLSLLTIQNVAKLDLFKTNSKADYVILDVDAAAGRIYIEPELDSISLLVETQFDGSCYRRGSDVTWVGYNNENEIILNNSNLGAVRRFNSVNMSQFAYFSNTLSTQAFAISAKDNDVTRLLYKWWPGVFKTLDESGDLEDLMGVFGYKFNEIYSLISTYELQNSRLLQPLPLSNSYRQYGLASEVSETLGIDTRRRIMNDLVPAWKLKGSREGLAKFIKIITTWDVTNGTGDIVRAIRDTTPELSGLRHYSPALGDLNTEIVDTTNPVSPPAGRFVRGIPGVNLEGFFNVVEILIELPNVAMFVGQSTNLSYHNGGTIIRATVEDTSTDFGMDNSLKGCFLIPIEGNPNDYYEIQSNTNDTITINGIIPQGLVGSKYVVLSPLNLNRFVALQSTITEQLSYRAVPVFSFTVKSI